MSKVLGAEKVRGEGRVQVNVAEPIENVSTDGSAATGAICSAIHTPRRDYRVRSWLRLVRCLPSEIRAILYHAILKSISLLGPGLAFRAAMMMGRIKHKVRGSRTIPLQSEISTSLRVTQGQASQCVARSNGIVIWEDVESYFRQGVDEKSLGELVDIRGLENLQSALHKGKGAVLCTGHVRGIFIFMVALYLMGYKVNAIRRSPKGLQVPIGRWFNRRITLARGGSSNFLSPHHHTLPSQAQPP